MHIKRKPQYDWVKKWATKSKKYKMMYLNNVELLFGVPKDAKEGSKGKSTCANGTPGTYGAYQVVKSSSRIG